MLSGAVSHSKTTEDPDCSLILGGFIVTGAPIMRGSYLPVVGFETWTENSLLPTALVAEPREIISSPNLRPHGSLERTDMGTSQTDLSLEDSLAVFSLHWGKGKNFPALERT
jgi:hypothetical protein